MLRIEGFWLVEMGYCARPMRHWMELCMARPTIEEEE